jgi:tetratricopeptide (TPR) repeat protein
MMPKAQRIRLTPLAAVSRLRRLSPFTASDHVSEKLKQKELKQPDTFQKVGGEASAWLVERQKQVVAALGVLLVGGGGVALASYFSQRGSSQATKDLGAALQPLTRPVTPGAPAPAGAVASEAPFESEKAKDEAVVASLEGFRKANPNGQAAVTAVLPLAQAQLRLGKFDQAIASFDEYLAKAAAENPLRASALEGKGYALEGKGDVDGALAAFEKLATDNKTEFLKGQGLLHKGRLLIQKGKKEEAAKVLAEVATVAPDSDAQRAATARLAVLASEGIVPPPAPVPAAAAAAIDAGS